MIQRQALPQLRKLLAQYPAVVLLGPRQCGKTTLAKTLGGHYIDMELESSRTKVDVRWDELTASHELVVFDEAHAAPEILPRLRAAIDADRKRNGRFLLLGSVSPHLMKEASESLAGRVAFWDLTPLQLGETGVSRIDDLWLKGGYPDGGILGGVGFPLWQRNYLTALAQRDLPQWGLPSKPAETLRLMRMIASHQGQVWNASKIGRSLGLSYHTVNTHADFLEGAFLLRRLPSYSGNIRKRLVKQPKVYWRDSGLLHTLLDVGSFDALLAQPWVGYSWEGFVIGQILDHCLVRGLDVAPSFVRTTDDSEADLVLRMGVKTWVVEIKLTTNPSVHDLNRLHPMAKAVGAERRCLISRTQEEVVAASEAYVSLGGFLRLLD